MKKNTFAPIIITTLLYCFSAYAETVILAEEPMAIIEETTVSETTGASVSDEIGSVPRQIIAPDVAPILSQQLLNVAATKYVKATNLNIRKQPNMAAEIVGNLGFNDEVEVISDINGWSMIKYNDQYVFVSSEFLSDEKQTMVSLGSFLLTAYCCEEYPHICNAGPPYVTRTGLKPRPGYIAVDPRIIPLHSKVMINGNIYQAEDTGGHIKGNRIDICMLTHTEAKKFGSKRAEVFLLK